jgi:arylsulfatase
MGAWQYAQDQRKAPLLIDLWADPFESAPEESSYYDDWLLRRMYVMVPLGDLVKNFMATFEEFPTRQEPGSFTPKQ